MFPVQSEGGGVSFRWKMLTVVVEDVCENARPNQGSAQGSLVTRSCVLSSRGASRLPWSQSILSAFPDAQCPGGLGCGELGVWVSFGMQCLLGCGCLLGRAQVCAAVTKERAGLAWWRPPGKLEAWLWVVG